MILFTALCFTQLKAQNTILFEDFESDTINIPITLANGDDATWINADYDGLDDQSGGGRPGEWFLSSGFANVDSTNTVLASNSWTLDPAPVANYIILPPIKLDDNSGILKWKSAPRQLPRYMDGYQVLVSTTGNFPENFTDTLKLFAEFTGNATIVDSSSYANLYNSFTFSNGYVHGLDGSYVEYNGDSLRFRGVLRPDSVSLAAYSGQTIYIAFCSGTTDDNLLSIDDILVQGVGQNLSVDNIENINTVNVFPNPATNDFNVAYTLNTSTKVELNVFDMNGRLVKQVSNAFQIKGNYNFNVNCNDLPAGIYNVELKTPKGKSTVSVTRL